MNEIRFDFKNLKPVMDANITLKKINVVSGVNYNEKSTLSKLIYCCLVSMTKEGNYFSNLNNLAAFLSLCSVCEKFMYLGNDFTNIDRDDGDFDKNLKCRIDFLKTIIPRFDFNKKRRFLRKLKELDLFVSLNLEDNWKYFNFFNLFISSELGHSFLDNFFKGSLSFKCRMDGLDFGYEIINKGNDISINLEDNISLFNDVIYLDSTASIFNFEKRLMDPYHNIHLEKILNKKASKKITEYDDTFKNLLKGSIHNDGDIFSTKFMRYGEEFPIDEMEDNIKLMSIIYLLIENNHLKDSFLILDDFDLNLTSQSLDTLADLLVSFVNKFNLTLFITTSNPKFIELIDLYSQIYGLLDDINYFLIDHGWVYEIDWDDLERIYNHLVNFS